MQNGESSRDLLLSVTNRKALAPGGGGGQPPEPPPRPLQNINYITTSHFLTLDPQLGVGWGKSLVLVLW